MEICKAELCTGCNLCDVICPQRCIKMENDKYDNLHPIINETDCIKCNLCVKYCPQNNEILQKEKIDYVQKVFAAVSTNRKIFENSASGGIATELYRYIIENDGYSCGVILEENLEANYTLITNMEQLSKTQNSKYVSSRMGKIYLEIKNILQSGRKFIFIGLPCQVAAVKSYLELTIKNQEIKKNIIYVDIICHGVMSSIYFKNHIKEILKTDIGTDIRCSFRNPKFGTNKFFFTIEKNGEILYKKDVKNTDNYQICYHNAISYRENCYLCKYATHKRIGDLTIGDFSGYGKIKKETIFKNKVSCIIVNSLKGEDIIKKLVKDKKIKIEERPVEEAFKYEKQLRMPSRKHKLRDSFLKNYETYKTFTKSANKTVYNIKIKNFLLNKSGYLLFRGKLSLFFYKYPKIKLILKQWCKR